MCMPENKLRGLVLYCHVGPPPGSSPSWDLAASTSYIELSAWAHSFIHTYIFIWRLLWEHLLLHSCTCKKCWMIIFSFKLNKTNFVLEWLCVSVRLWDHLPYRVGPLETEVVVSLQPPATDEQRYQPLWPQLLVACHHETDWNQPPFPGPETGCSLYKPLF